MKSPYTPSVGVFRRKDRFIILPRNRTTAGVYVGTSPTLTAHLDVSAEQLGEMVLRSLEVGEDGVPHPEDWSNVPHPLWDAAGVRTWAAFAKGALNCDVYREGKMLRIQPMKNMGVKRGFLTIHEGVRTIPADSTPSVLGDSVLQAIRLAESDI